MRESRNLFLTTASTVAFAVILVTSVRVTVAHAQTVTVLHNFGDVAGASYGPQFGPIAQGRDGNLYAATSYGGSTNCGTLFKITPTGTLTVLSNLGGNAGCNPVGGLTLGRGGNFYGTTAFGGSGGAGTMFQITPNGKLAVLHSFANDTNGSEPLAVPIQGADGNLYGTTYGAFNPTPGTIYKLTPHQQLTTLYQFRNGHDGTEPDAPLLQATDGSFYGIASISAFKISPAGAFTILGPLPGYGYSDAPMIQTTNGNIYGVAKTGGTYGNGSVFEITRTGKTTVLYSFNPETDGWSPIAGLVQATDGNFYGTTQYGGVLDDGLIYRLTPTGDFSVLYDFDGATGEHPTTTLVQHTNGILYGETYAGGAHGAGVFYRLDIGAAPFVRLVTTFGKVGRTTSASLVKASREPPMFPSTAYPPLSPSRRIPTWRPPSPPALRPASSP